MPKLSKIAAARAAFINSLCKEGTAYLFAITTKTRNGEQCVIKDRSEVIARIGGYGLDMVPHVLQTALNGLASKGRLPVGNGCNSLEGALKSIGWTLEKVTETKGVKVFRISSWGYLNTEAGHNPAWRPDWNDRAA